MSAPPLCIAGWFYYHPWGKNIPFKFTKKGKVSGGLKEHFARDSTFLKFNLNLLRPSLWYTINYSLETGNLYIFSTPTFIKNNRKMCRASLPLRSHTTHKEGVFYPEGRGRQTGGIYTDLFTYHDFLLRRGEGSHTFTVHCLGAYIYPRRGGIFCWASQWGKKTTSFYKGGGLPQHKNRTGLFYATHKFLWIVKRTSPFFDDNAEKCFTHGRCADCAGEHKVRSGEDT